MLEHAGLLSECMGEEHAMRQFRRHATWYTKGFRGSAQLRQKLTKVCSIDELRTALDSFDSSEPFPPGAMRVKRGKTGGRQRVTLPDGWCDDPNDATPPVDIPLELMSGG
jgi:hypothetical protein